ncbi:MAG TPA: L-2-hydroxyglutarate oxidase [Bacillales bacterium]|nr:L-2-hydroxyglutarate oxidase [Bacillales bacterium]
MADFTVIGAGIIGLATAFKLSQRFPDQNIVVLEKEDRPAAHQTGHNSGVIHSGIYYRPGSLKAKLAREGNKDMYEFCEEHGVSYRKTGKIIAAVKDEELAALENLYQRGKTNGLEVKRMTGEEIRRVEPYVNAVAGIYVSSTGIVDFSEVAETLVRLLRERNVKIHFSTRVTDLDVHESGVSIETDHGKIRSRQVVNCAGLFSDRIARMSGIEPDAQIVPFRGEYYKFAPEKRDRVNGLVYPVPDPAFPFLGVHFTKMIDGGVHIGPNAVPGLMREGYRKSDFDLDDFREIVTNPGLWKLAFRYLPMGVQEMWRSFNKKAFTRNVQQYVPEITEEDLVPVEAGVRAQALTNEGKLLDDFFIIRDRLALHVLNAPSPAATASFKIADYIVDRQ